jgi:hypothetical protein
MQKYQKIVSKSYVWLGIVGALIMVYPNLVYIPWHMEWPCVQEHLWIYWSFHVFRFCYFAMFFMLVYRLAIANTMFVLIINIGYAKIKRIFGDSKFLNKKF